MTGREPTPPVGWVEGERGWKARVVGAWIEVQAAWGAMYRMPAPPPYSAPRRYVLCDRLEMGSPDTDVDGNVGISWELMYCLGDPDPESGWDPVAALQVSWHGSRVAAL